MKPEIVCLCGSTRFTEQMLVVRWELEKQGKIVLTWNALPDSYVNEKHAGLVKNIAEAENCKEQLDELHKRKIDLADRILVINIGDYIGDSTKSEVEYALSLGRRVDWLEHHRECQYPGCPSPLTMRPPCPLCYE